MLISFYDRQVKKREKRRKLGYNNIDTLQKKKKKRRTKWKERERERERENIVKLQRRRWKNKKKEESSFLNRRGWISAGKAIHNTFHRHLSKIPICIGSGRTIFPQWDWIIHQQQQQQLGPQTNKLTTKQQLVCVCVCVDFSSQTHRQTQSNIVGRFFSY